MEIEIIQDEMSKYNNSVNKMTEENMKMKGKLTKEQEVKKMINSDKISLLITKIDNDYKMKQAFEKLLSKLKTLRSKDIEMMKKPHVNKLLAKELLRQIDRDNVAEQKLGDITGKNALDKRVKFYYDIYKKEVEGVHGALVHKDQLCLSVKDMYSDRLLDAQKLYKKYVLKRLDAMNNELLHYLNVKDRYAEVLSKYDTVEEMKKELFNVDQMIIKLKGEIQEIKGIHMSVLEDIKKRDNDRRRRYLLRVLNAQNTLEHIKVHFNNHVKEEKELTKKLNLRHHFVPRRWEVVHRRDHLKRLIERQTKTMKELKMKLRRYNRRYMSDLTRRLHRVNKKIERLEIRKESIRKSMIMLNDQMEKYKEKSKLDASLTSYNMIKKIQRQIELNKVQMIEVTKELSKQEKKRDWFEFALKADERRVAIKRIFKKLLKLRGMIHSAKKRGLFARERLQHFKLKDKTMKIMRCIKNYAIMLKIAQRDQKRAIQRRDILVKRSKFVIKKQIKYYEKLKMLLTAELNRYGKERDELSKKALYDVDNKDASERLVILDKAIQQMDETVYKLEIIIARLKKLVGWLQPSPKSMMCKASKKCQMCRIIGDIAKTTLIRAKGDNYAMAKANAYCETRQGVEKEKCFKIALGIFEQFAHSIDPLKMNVKRACKRLGNC